MGITKSFALADTDLVYENEIYFQNEVTGTVIDSNGLPLVGVNIILKGTSTGVQTNFDGNYSINIPADGTLVFSYVGFETQEILAEGRSSINITMTEEANQLENVVLIGYGSSSRSSVTNAIGSIKSDDLIETPVIGVQQAIQGRVAGVQVTNAGAPGTDPLISIRGLGTFGESQPLFIVDGVPTRSLNNIPAESIESVDILKDASSAAIYGSRGSNGVVLIKTKGGKRGKTNLKFSTYTGFSQVTNQLDVLNTSQYVDYITSEYDADSDLDGQQTFNVFLSPDFDPSINTDWQDEIFRSALVRNYDIEASGGGDNGIYSIRASYLDQEGTLINTGFQRYSFNINTKININDKLEVGQNVILGISETTNQQDKGGSSVIRNALAMPTYLPVFDTNTNFFSTTSTGFDGQDALNPVQILTYNEDLTKQTSIVGSLFASYEILNGLKYKIVVGIDHSNSRRTRIDRPVLTGQQATDFNLLRNNEGRFLSTVITHTLDYKTTINQTHNLNFLAGYERIKNKNEFSNVTSANSGTNTELDLLVDLNDVRALASFNIPYALHSVFGRIGYDYKKMFLINATIRRDGSSRFGEDNRYGTFPSVSAGVNLGRILFDGDHTLNNLKLRGSWGITGNDNIPNYLSEAGIQTNYNAVFDAGLRSGARPNRLANPNLQWEELISTNIGLDIGLWNNSLTLSAEYFKNESDELLVGIPTAPSLGNSVRRLTQNAGGTKTDGFEFNLGYNYTGAEFSFSAGLNAAFISTEVTSLGDVVEEINDGNIAGQSVNRLIEGEPLYHFYGLQTNGIFQNQAEVDAHATQAGAAPGNIRYVDVNNDGDINDDDRTSIGDPNPDLTLGFNIDLTYKNFDASIFVNGVYGNEIYNGTKYFLEEQSRPFNRGTAVLDRWTPSNPSSTVPATTPGFSGNELVSDRFIEDGSFTRIRNVTLGYSIDNKTLNSITNGVLSKFRIYITGQNLYTFTDYSGYDPEIAPIRSGGSVNAIGLDLVSYTQPRTFIAGVQVEF